MTTVKRCYYQVLQLKRTATNDEVKKSFRKLAVKWHPDKNPDNKQQASDKFKQLSEAYEILSDETKKKEYDLYGHGGPKKYTSSTFTNNKADDIFKTFFSRFGFESTYDQELFGNRYGGSATYFSRKASTGGQPTYGSMGSNYQEILKNHFGADKPNGSTAGYSRASSYGTGTRYTTTGATGSSYGGTTGSSYGGAAGKTYVRVKETYGGSGYGSNGVFSGKGTTIGGDEQVPREKRYARFEQQENESNDTTTDMPTKQSSYEDKSTSNSSTRQDGNTKVQTTVNYKNGIKVTITKTIVTKADGSREFNEQTVEQNVPGKTIRRYTLPAGCPDIAV